jgi:hypothetical protein
MTPSSDRTLERIERQLKAIGSELQSVVRALVGIQEVFKENNRARDRWARAVVQVLEDAREETNADADGD